MKNKPLPGGPQLWLYETVLKHDHLQICTRSADDTKWLHKTEVTGPVRVVLVSFCTVGADIGVEEAYGWGLVGGRGMCGFWPPTLGMSVGDIAAQTPPKNRAWTRLA